MSEVWPFVSLADVLRLDLDQVAVDPAQSYPIVGVLNRGRGLLLRESIRGADTSYPKLNRVRPEQVVYSRLKAFEGAVTVVPSTVKGFASPEFPTFTCSDQLLPDFMRLITTMPWFWEALEGLSKGMGGRRERVSPSDFLTVQLALPPIEVQRRFVELVRRMDEHVLALRQECESALTELASFRAQALTQGSPTTAGKAFEILMGRQRSPQRASGPGMTKYLRAANIKDGRLSLDDVKEMDFDEQERETFGLAHGDVLVSEGSGSRDAVGASARWQSELPGVVCFQNTLLRFRARPHVTIPSFVYHWCRYAYDSRAFQRAATGTNILHIGASRAVSMPLLVPDVATQADICLQLDLREELVVALSLEADRLALLRQHALAALFRRELEVADSYDSLIGEAAY